RCWSPSWLAPLRIGAMDIVALTLRERLANVPVPVSLCERPACLSSSARTTFGDAGDGLGGRNRRSGLRPQPRPARAGGGGLAGQRPALAPPLRQPRRRPRLDRRFQEGVRGSARL